MILPLVLIIFNYSSDTIEMFNRYTESYSVFQYSEKKR